MPDEIDILVEELLAGSMCAHNVNDGVGTKKTGYALPEMGPFECEHCVHAGEDGTRCDHPQVLADEDVPKTEDQKQAIVKPHACCNFFHPLDEIEAYGTSEGVKKAWDTRGRGVKPRPLGPPRYRRFDRSRPHDPNSAIGKLMDMAQREQGVGVAEAKKFLLENNTRLWVISFVRKGEGNGFRWKVIDDGKKSGTIKVGKPEKIPDAELAQKKEEPVAVPKDSTGAEVHLLSTPISDSNPLGGGMNPSRVVDFSDGTKGVFKPDPVHESGDNRTRNNIPLGQETEREVAAWQVAKLAGMDDLVSPAVIKTIDGERGALLEWQNGTTAGGLVDEEQFDGMYDAERAAAFDFVIGNEDRHSYNWLVEGSSSQGKLHLIDHGLAFPERQYESWHNELILNHQKVYHGDEKPNKDIVDKFVKAQPQIEAMLKKFGFDDEVISGVKRRIGILSTSQHWDDVKERDSNG